MRSPVHLHQVSHDGKAEPQATCGTLEGLRLLHEQVEHGFGQLRSNPGALVLDHRLDRSPTRSATIVIPDPGSLYLDAFVSKFENT